MGQHQALSRRRRKGAQGLHQLRPAVNGGPIWQRPASPSASADGGARRPGRAIRFAHSVDLQLVQVLAPVAA